MDQDRYGAAFHVQDLREQLAKADEDTDRYIHVVARNLRNPDQYLKIVEALRDAGRADEATTWARGLAAHSTSPYLPPLRDALVDLLIEAGDDQEALAVRRTAFERTPVHAVFRPLRATTVRLGSPQTVSWAQDPLRERLPDKPRLRPGADPVPARRRNSTTTPGRWPSTASTSWAHTCCRT
ncbi:hypothetical protein ADL28_31980 [Streptomyces violaceusniger]|uniref:Bacterial transcriptional activator domain-containing protein n=2 Tax=Streptomyces violaceusniger group TaxID=2839105 RepID=A0ABD5JNX5_9ACTN|nr:MULTISPECIES: DUF6880 family protein [Streptomyces]KUL47627.1 hypothetical protein ADL28_31980 [Streptomyces violaceusniger]MEE4589594.1 hypothetical protein [Streptomyces sp. DSM 41602]